MKSFPMVKTARQVSKLLRKTFWHGPEKRADADRAGGQKQNSEVTQGRTGGTGCPIAENLSIPGILVGQLGG